MEHIIHAILRALKDGYTLDQIHDAMTSEGWNEDDFFLAYQAASNLYDAIKKQEYELQDRKI